MKRNAAIYVRSSSVSGLNLQRRVVRAFARRGGFAIADRHVFTDLAPGRSSPRGGLDKLRRAAGAHEFGVVIVADMSRLARSRRVASIVIAELRARGVRVALMAE